ncbi:MAG: hypothetical protein R6X02_35005 [Enhygromyxa sp.]
MRLALAVLLSTLALAPAACRRGDSSSTPAVGDRGSIPDRLTRATELGREIHRRDMLGWWASDLALAYLEPGDAERLRGWVLDADDPGTVHFFGDYDGQLGTLVLVRCDGSGPQGCAAERLASPAPLSEQNLAQLRALTAAGSHPEFAPSSESYNHVVLPADDSRWWVYLIAATTDPDLVMLGRHYRFLVSPDGAEVLEWRAFSKSALVIDRSAELPEGASVAAHVVTHLLDDIPTEMHVWAALNYQTPIGVVTEAGVLWMVDPSGAIDQVDQVDSTH